MSKNIKLLIAGVCLLATLTEIQAQNKHLQCWHCSSDTIGAEDFCGTTFQEDNIPTEVIKERNISLLRTCNSSINSDHERAVCRKTVEEYNGKTITKRFCYYTNKSDPLEHCNTTTTDKSVRRIFCEDCLTDRCNSASQLVAMLGVVLLPIGIAKFFGI